MKTNRQTLSLALLVFGGATAVFLFRHRAQVDQRVEIQTLLHQLQSVTEANQSLSNQLAEASLTRSPELPLPHHGEIPSPPKVAPEIPAATNLYTLMTTNNATLTVSQLDHCLGSNQRSAASLLAAFRTTGEPDLL